MSEIRLAIVECRYPYDVQDELLKDQYIFSLCAKEFQNHLLGEIVPEDTAEKCLLESRKIELKIEQRKLLSIKTSMTYDAVFRGRDRSRNSQNKSRDCSNCVIKSCKYSGKPHNTGNCLAFGKKCHRFCRDNYFKSMCKT